MSSTESSSNASSLVSENEYLSENEEMSDDGACEIETSIIEGSTTAETSKVLGDDATFACSDDPVADEEWTAEYEEEIRQADILEEKMQKRLNGTTDISEWYSIIIVNTLFIAVYKIFIVYSVF